jgi:hypothetical protein
MKKLIVLPWAALAFTLVAADTQLIPKGLLPDSLSAGKKSSRPSLRPELPPFESPETMQAEFVRRFEASPGFGMMRVIRPVFMAPSPALMFSGTKYQVAPPDLIGLENQPVVYAAREHSFLRAKTNSEVRELFQARALSALETNAVASLRKGTDLVVKTIAPDAAAARNNHAPSLLVVGALRASASCANCHGCDKGTLLGAFTYTLKPVESASNTVAAAGIPLNSIFHAPASGPEALLSVIGCSALVTER